MGRCTNGYGHFYLSSPSHKLLKTLPKYKLNFKSPLRRQPTLSILSFFLAVWKFFIIIFYMFIRGNTNPFNMHWYNSRVCQYCFLYVDQYVKRYICRKKNRDNSIKVWVLKHNVPQFPNFNLLELLSISLTLIRRKSNIELSSEQLALLKVFISFSKHDIWYVGNV